MSTNQQNIYSHVAFNSGLKEMIIIKSLDISIDVFDAENLRSEFLCLIKGLGENDFFDWLSIEKINGFRLLQKAWLK